MYKVLIADDARVMRFATMRILHRLGLEAVEAEDGIQALEKFTSESPDLVLMDVQMPGMDGLEVVRRIRELSKERWVPVIFLTSMEDDEDFGRGIEAGGDDYLTKPVSPVVLEAKIRAMRRLDDMRRELTAVTLELREANERLSRLSQQDGLTGLANRRRFDLDLARELARSRRDKLPLSLLIADIDHFKRYNDSYGHPAGDECLRRVAAALRTAFRRPLDVVARYGGEEFAVILPDTAEEAARHCAEEAMRALAELAIEHNDSPAAAVVTLSAGISGCVPECDLLPEALVERADRALYAAKHAGRNRIVAFSELPLPGLAPPAPGQPGLVLH